MAASVGTPSPPPLNQRSASLMGSSSFISPSSDKRFWSTLRNRVDVLIDERSSRISTSEDAEAADLNIPNKSDVSKSERAKKLKEDSLLLMRGFDSVSQTLSQLSETLDNALLGARDLAKPPTLTEIFHCNLRKLEAEEDSPERENELEVEPIGGRKRKLDQGQEWSEDLERDSEEGIEEAQKENGLKKAKNLAVTMATRAASLARELKSLKSNLCFLQERSALLEEENRRLRDGFARGIRPEEDDLMRLQMEALLAEKSRLANENASLVRENQCLHQLVEYHQITSQDLSASSYEQFIQGMCLDFSSPPPAIGEEEEFFEGKDDENNEVPQTPPADSFRFSTIFEENEQ